MKNFARQNSSEKKTWGILGKIQTYEIPNNANGKEIVPLNNNSFAAWDSTKSNYRIRPHMPQQGGVVPQDVPSPTPVPVSPTPTPTSTSTPTPTPTSTPATTYILDTYPNAAIAYSTRKLRAAYTGAALRVRRSSDNAELDIPFNGDSIDISVLSTFVGSNDGRVTVWYDQSGNNSDLTQTTAAKQPFIMESGVLITENSLPVLKGIQTYTSLTNTGMIQSTDITSPFLISAAFTEETSEAGLRAFHANNQNALISSRRTDNNTVFTEGTIYNNQWGTEGVMQVTSFRKSPADTSTLYTNNTSILINVTTNSNKFGTIGIGAGDVYTAGESSNGRWGELIAWKLTFSINPSRAGVSTNQQTYWI